MKYTLTYRRYGDSAILIEWPARIEELIIKDIIGFEKKLKFDNEIIDTIIAYNSLTIQFRFLIDFNKKVFRLKELYKLKYSDKKNQNRIWEIPVCYDPEFGLDLEEVSKVKRISIKEVVDIHLKPSYLVYFLGFQPGFLYLGGLDKKIHTPRKSTPRLRVQKGSVGIGGEQTGVYPSNNSGGWNIIGKSPVDFFNLDNLQPCFAKAGDRIQFFSIDVDNYHSIKRAVESGEYQPKFEEF